MVFPFSPREIYDKNPLDEVICQLRFPPILEIVANSPAKFQNSIRESYPFYQKHSVGGSSLPVDIPDEFKSLLSSILKDKNDDLVDHRFMSEDENRTITLAQNFVAVSEKSYKQWEFFVTEVEKASKALEEIYHPTFYTRIGLRYKDVINKKDLGLADEKWSDLIRPSVLGLLGTQELDNKVNNIYSEIQFRIDELPGAFVNLRHGFGEIKGEKRNNDIYVFDIDFFMAERRAAQDVRKILDFFHIGTGNFFRWVITEKLRTALGPRPINA